MNSQQDPSADEPVTAHPHIPPPNEQDCAHEAQDAPAPLEQTPSDLSSPTPTQHAPTDDPTAGMRTYLDGNADGNADDAVVTPGSMSVRSASSEHPGGQDPGDRVFPIRSVVRVAPPGTGPSGAEYFPPLASEGVSSSTAYPHGPRVPSTVSRRPASTSVTSDTLKSTTSSLKSPTPARPRRLNTSSSSIQADAERHGSHGPLPLFADHASDEEDAASEATWGTGGTGGTGGSLRGSSTGGRGTPSESGALMTTRFKHVITDEGHAVITGRDETLQRCEDEPIHTPGAVQGFGLLIAVREEDDGRFSVRYVSENSRRIIGYSPQELFRLGNFLDIMTEEQADNLLDHIDFIRDEDAEPGVNGPEVFSMSIRPPRKKSTKLWCAIHSNPAHPNLIICEFELDDDHDNPLRPSDESTPDIPEDTLQANPTFEELTESTEIMSKPLRVLRSARKRRGEAGAMQVFDIMSQIQDQLASAPNLELFLKILVGIIKELTGFHRVMIYQFDSFFNGKVVTELVDPIKTKDLYHGLHFPASDIPRQARELYKINKVRLLYDRDQETARIVCRSKEDLETPLDMTHAYLRAMSPIHLKYLAHMAVRSSMSVSINAFNELWGLIACHSYGPRGMRVSFPIRKMCRLVGETVSRNIERLSYASRLQARKLINTVPTDKNPSGYIIASSDDLLKLFDADFGMLSIKGETKILGKIEQTQEALAMLEYLRMRKFTSVLTTQDIKIDFPDLRYPPGFSVIAGLLLVPLTVGGNDFIVFFRKGQVREVKWAGNPYDKLIREGTNNYLEPRKSFKTWYETVLGKCREWSEEQVETAAVLCLVYGKFIEVWRQKEAALQSSRLTRLLLANSAHEVRTPLNAIINYLEIALEGTLDQETRDNLAKSHSASKSLIYVINDLLDLTKTEEGQELVKDEVFDLPACIREATQPFETDAKRKSINYEVIEHPGLPRYVYGDQRRVRQAVANVTANAVEHTSHGSVKIELYAAEVEDRRVRVEVAVEDTGDGMSNEQLDALFRDLEQVSTELDDSRPEDEQETIASGKRTLGLGLAVVARIVRNMDGQLRLKSELGQGSRFIIQLAFDLPTDEPSPVADSRNRSEGTGGSVSATVPLPEAGEVTLVERTTPALAEKKDDETTSLSSLPSATSKGSIHSNRSDADRLIDAIQMPLGLGEPESEELSHQRSRSNGAYYRPTAVTFSGDDTGRSLSPPTSAQRPSAPSRAVSSPDYSTALTDTAPIGKRFVTDTKTPIRPVKVPDDGDEYHNLPEHPQPSQTSRVLYEVPGTPTTGEGAETPTAGQSGQTRMKPLPDSAELQVLVAEDDPINMKILRKRLEKAGHRVYHAVNGEDCATLYKENPRAYDVILMDMQMPIVDGLGSTKLIRAFERSGQHSGLSQIAGHHGRIPIFAVSASLLEKDKDTYVEGGFDGWILKPVDFKRLNILLLGIIDDATRNECLYAPGGWERGGWFDKRLNLPEKDMTTHAAPLTDGPLQGGEVAAARNAAKP